MNLIRKIILVIIFACFYVSSYAYDEHALITYFALGKDLRGVSVKIEPLGEFLIREQVEIAKALSEAESWCKTNLPEYNPLPENLVFAAMGDPSDIESRFLRSIRVNTEYFRYNFLHDIGGNLSIKLPDRIMDWKELYISNFNYHSKIPFLRVKHGDIVPAINVISTASDIPDCGIDCGLFADNNTALSGIYGFGNQLFGDPAKPFHQMAPFHMPYYHDAVLTTAIPNLKSPYAIYRVKYYSEIAKVAFRTKHYYWGYYFAGLALHYVVDCCLPYHISIAPGTSGQYILDEINKNNNYIDRVLIPRISAQHSFMEAYIFNNFIEERNGGKKPYFKNAVSDSRADGNVFSSDYDMFIVTVLAKKAFDIGEVIGPLIEDITDETKMESEIATRIDSGNYYVDDFILHGKDKEKEEFKTKCYDALVLAGSGTRAY